MQVVRQTSLSANIVAFCRHLRNNGISIGPLEQADALQAMTLLPVTQPEELQLSLRAILTKSRKDQQQFDKLYGKYWQELLRAVDSKIKEDDQETATDNTDTAHARGNSPSLQSLKNWLNSNKAGEQEELAAYSPVEILTAKDFSSFNDAELHEVMKLLAIITKSMAIKFSRRYRATSRPDEMDWRRSIRLGMRRGGDLINIAFRRRKIQKLDLVVLCDVSKSMDLYSHFLLQFIYGFQHVYRRIESFVFSTALHRISEHFREGDYRAALKRLAETIPEWSGGTQIGKCFRTFLTRYGAEVLSKKTIVIIMSDGWDTGDIELLADCMREIRANAGRVIWLNPLAGSDHYEPSVGGMQAALPFVDTFAPLHNIDSLKQLVRHLKAAHSRVTRVKRRD